MTQILLIAPSASGPAARRRYRDLARSLRERGHRVSVLAPRPAAWRGRRAEASGAAAADDRPVGPVGLPPGGDLLPGAFDAALRRLLPAAVRRAGLERPEVVVAGAADESAVIARTLSTLYGLPTVLLLDGSDPLPAPRGGRAEQLLAQSVQDMSIVAAASPDLAEQLRARFTLPGVAVRPAAADGDPAAVLEELCTRAVDGEAGSRMVFHAPYPLDPAPSSASRQRPNQMLAAFTANGHRIHRITGNPFQRTLAFRDLRRRVAAGQEIEFLYSENSTQPNLLATSLRHGLAPFLEARILGYCRRRRIPVGQFYRDVYWRFAESQAAVPPARRALMQIAYRADLAVLHLTRAHLFLPSLPMAPIVPVAAERSSALPPGAPVHDSPSPEGLELLYVGGIGPGYALDEGLRALQDVPQARLTMVVRPQEWEVHRARYEELLTERVRVVHAGSDELQEIYDRASACLLLVAPDGYRRFAVPLKLYEYLGYGKPTLASQGTLAGDLVEEMGSGFTVANAHEDIAALLRRLGEDPALLEGAAERARAARRENTWAMRARTVAEVLTGRRSV